MSMSLPISYPELEFPPVPNSPSFASLFTNNSSDLWCDQSLSLMDDCDSVSMLSNSSGDETSSPGSFFEQSAQFIDPMMFVAPAAVYDNKASPTFMNQGFKFEPYRFETVLPLPVQQCAEPVMEPVIVDPIPQPLTSAPQVPERKKSSKRRASSSNSSVASAESHDSTKTRKSKRAKHSSNDDSESDIRNTSTTPNSPSLPHVDAGLVSSLLAESELKKNRLARKAELARLGRKAKNDQIESLQKTLKDLKARLQAAKDRNANLAIFPHGSPVVKVEHQAPVARISIPEAFSVLDVSYSAHATLVPRFMNWLSNQNDKFYCDSNTRGLFTSLTDKSLGLTEQQKRLFVHVLKSHASRQPVVAVADRFEAADKVVKQAKLSK